MTHRIFKVLLIDGDAGGFERATSPGLNIRVCGASGISYRQIVRQGAAFQIQIQPTCLQALSRSRSLAPSEKAGNLLC